MRAFLHHFLFELRGGIRNRTLLLMTYLLPLGFYLMVGLIMPSVNPFFLQAMVPAMLVFSVLSSTLLGLPDPLINARSSGVLRSFRIYGVPSRAILLVPVLTGLLHLLVIAAIILTTAPLLFGAPMPSNWGGLALSFLSLVCACSGLGVLIGVISPSTGAQVLLSQVIFIPSMLLGGLMLPARMLPPVAQLVAQLLPAAHAMNALNGLAMDQVSRPNPFLSVGVLLGGGLVAFSLAVFLFRWDDNTPPGRLRTAVAGLALLPYLAVCVAGLKT